jgi:hypothetical protein
MHDAFQLEFLRIWSVHGLSLFSLGDGDDGHVTFL